MAVMERKLCLSAHIIATLFGALLLKTVIITGFQHCPEYFFPCANGECINSELWCDYHQDCSDESDELYCKKVSIFNSNPNLCSSFYFRCMHGPCIPLVGRCDGYGDCADSSDEKDCEYYHTTESPSIFSSANESEGFNAKQFFASLNSSEASFQVHKFSGLGISNFPRQRNSARKWLLSQRKSNFGWDDETHRAIMALYLSDEQPMSRSTESGMLMIKQLEIEILFKLLRKGTKPMKLTDLALYINALLVSCKDPKNFYGVNLVHALRDRADVVQRNNRFINPSVYLTLCINNASTYEDTRKLHGIFFSRNSTIGKIDIQALALMATSCHFRKTDFLNASVFNNIQMEFFRTVKVNGFPGNVYEAALLSQALQEIDLTIVGLVYFILKQQQADGSFGDILSTYLVLPILAGKHMMQVDSHCGQRNITNMAPTGVLENVRSKKMFVQYSLIYESKPEIKQTIQMRVPERSSFLDIMRLPQEINSNYRFQLDDNHGFPVVYSICEIPNDAEKGMYWLLYKASRNISKIPNEKNWDHYNGDIKELILADGDKLTFWYRRLEH